MTPDLDEALGILLDALRQSTPEECLPMEDHKLVRLAAALLREAHERQREVMDWHEGGHRC